MGCCGSKNIEQTVVSKAEREELLDKTMNEISSMTELRVIDLECDSLVALLSQISSSHSPFIEYVLFFMDKLHETILSASQQHVISMDPKALQVIRTGIQKLHAMVKKGDPKDIKGEDQDGSLIARLLQDFELNVMVLNKGKMPIEITKALIEEQANEYDAKSFSFIFACGFWKNSLQKDFVMENNLKWHDFKPKFTGFAENYYKKQLKNEDFSLLRAFLDKTEDQIVSHQDWDAFFKKHWLTWKARKQLFESKPNENLKEAPQNQLNLTKIKLSQPPEVEFHLILKQKEQFCSKTNQFFTKNLLEESFSLVEIEKTLIFPSFFMKESGSFFLNCPRSESYAKYILKGEDVRLSEDMVLETETGRVRVEKIEEIGVSIEAYDLSWGLRGKNAVSGRNCDELLRNYGFPEDFKLSKDKTEGFWVISRGKPAFLVRNSIFVLLEGFQEIKRLDRRPKRLIPGRSLLLEGEVFLLSEGAYKEPELDKISLSKHEEKDTLGKHQENEENSKENKEKDQKKIEITLEKSPEKAIDFNRKELPKEVQSVTLQLPKAASPIRKKLSKSNSMEPVIFTSKGQKINKNIVNRIQLLEKLFTGSVNNELPTFEEEEEEKDMRPSPEKLSSAHKKSSSRRKRSGSLEKYVKSPSGKKSIHVNILDRVKLLEKHFGSSETVELPRLKEEEERKEERTEEDEVYGPNGFAHWTLARPKHPYKHKKKSMNRLMRQKTMGN